MNTKKKITSKDKTGLKEHVISFRLTNSELIELDRNMMNAGLKKRADIIKSLIFNRTVSVIKVDLSIQNYLIRLNNLQAEYRAIGNNYNQVTKAIHTAFSEKKALAFLYKLEEITIELIRVNKEIIQLSKEFNEKWLQK